MVKSLDEQLNAFALHLIEREADICPRSNKRSAKEHVKFLQSTAWLCRRLLLAHTAYKGSSIRISRDKNRYTKSRYVPEGVTYTIAVEGVLNLLNILGYVQLTNRGSFDRRSGKGDQTRYTPTKAFIRHFKFVSNTLPKQLTGHEDTDNVVVQVTTERKMKWMDSKPKLFPIKTKKNYTDNEQTDRWRKNLSIINNCLKEHWADLYLTDKYWFKLNKQLVKNKDHDYSPIQLHRQTLRRIFNSTSFDKGGRFYGAWWQNIPSEYRAFITIDGKFTDEFDYGKLHPTILYAEKGIILEDDAYEIGIGDEHRDVVKQVFNAMVQMKQPSNTPPRDIDFKSTGRAWKQIRELILKKHEPIKDSFFRGQGNKLQFSDSQLAEQIMLHFAKKDIPILPVHDSFIIRRGLFMDLVDVMHDEFEKMFSVPIKIDNKPMMIPKSKAPEEVDLKWIISETDKYSNWEERN